jgi:hypothetical protein
VKSRGLTDEHHCPLPENRTRMLRRNRRPICRARDYIEAHELQRGEENFTLKML